MRRTLLAAAIGFGIMGKAFADETTADIVQVGDQNAVTVTQTSVSYSGAYTLQSGNNQEITLNQTGYSYFKGTQYGVDNQATVNQNGGSNVAEVYQASEERAHFVTLDQRGTANSAYLTQADGNSNYINLEQNGFANSSNVNQTWEGSSYVGTQVGEFNSATTNQSGASANVDQAGNRNETTLYQEGYGFGAHVSVSQAGDSNSANVAQFGNRYSAGTVILSQNGDDNRANVNEMSGMGSFTFSQTSQPNQEMIETK